MAKSISLRKWVRTMNHALTLGVKYGFGSKFGDITMWTPPEKRVDCSGFIRWGIYHASGGTVTAPDGSWNQKEWCIKEGFQRVHYDAARTDRRGFVYLAGYSPKKWRAGHIWFCRNGISWESHGGKGIAVRNASTLVLRRRSEWCFLLSSDVGGD